MSWKEECGVVGVWNHEHAARLSYLWSLCHATSRARVCRYCFSLYQQQHLHHKGLGLVDTVFDEEALSRLQGDVAIGHVRYSTTGMNLLECAAADCEFVIGPSRIGAQWKYC